MPNNNSIQKRNPQESDHMIHVDSDYEYGYGAQYGSGGSTERQQLSNLFSILRKYWLMILAITLVGTICVTLYEARKPDYYTAEVRVQVNNEVNPAAGGNAPSSIVLNQGSDPGYFTTQLQILEGAGLLRRVVKSLDLEHNSTFFGPGDDQKASVFQNVLRMFGLYKTPKPKRANQTEAANNINLDSKVYTTSDLDSQAEQLAPYVHFIKGGLWVSPVKDNRTVNKETRLINIEFKHYDPVMATKVVNSLADTYVLQNLEQKVESNASASDFLQKRVAELQSQIREGEERLINYAKSNQILSLDTSQNTVVQRLSDLNKTLSQAENDRINAEAAYRAALQNPMSGAAAQNRDARTGALEAQLTGLRQQLEQLKAEYTDEWPEVKRVQRQIAAIETELRSSRKRSTDTQIASLEQAFRETSSRERELRTNFEAQRNRVLAQNEAAINYRIIQQEIDTNKSLLENLLKRSRETEVILNGTPNNVHVVDRALVPGSPSGPERIKNVIVAFFASLFAGIGLAFALNWLDDTIRVSDDLENQLDSNVIGMIPGAPQGLAKRLLYSKFGSNGRRLSANHSYSLKDFERPATIEAFHQLRTSLLMSGAGSSPKTVLVTSGQPAEGKTVTSLNLAKSLAQLGGKVLLVDADLRCPKLHILNGVDNAVGLSSLLTSRDVNAKSIDKAIYKEIENNLDLLPSGPTVLNPTNLFASSEMRSLMEIASGKYSHIVIDSPPILYFADSVILATCVDGIVIVARANFSSRQVLLKAKKKVQDVNGNLVGVVLNDIPITNYKYYGNGYYSQATEAPSEDAPSNFLGLN